MLKFLFLSTSIFFFLSNNLRNLGLDSVNANTSVFSDLNGHDYHYVLKKYNNARIIALNKITAKSNEIVIKVGHNCYFGNIEVKVHKCFKNIDPYSPDSKILLTVTENKADEEPIKIFQGWLYSSSISFSTFEHPIYEIFANDCF